MNKLRIATFILLCFIPVLSFAEIYQCTKSDGKAYFSNSPCLDGEQTKNIESHQVNRIKAAESHSIFENANYKVKPYHVEYNVSDKYACAEICRQDDRCVVATYHDKTVAKKKRFRCQLRDKLKNKHVNQPGTTSWVK